MNISWQIEKLKKQMSKNFSEASIKSYSGTVKVFLNRVGDKYNTPESIPTPVIKKFLDNIKVPNTQKIYSLGLKYYYCKVLKQAGRFDTIKYKTPPKNPVKQLRVAEVQAMFDACRTEKQRICMAMIYSCGLRSGELLGLKLRDVDLVKMRLKVSKRTIQLPPSIKPLIEKYLRLYSPQIYFLNGRTVKHKFSNSSLRHIIQILKQRGVVKSPVNPEILRQVSYMHMFTAGVDPKVLQLIAGHKSARSTKAIIKQRRRVESFSPLKNIDLYR